jgi:hypothetical protein
MLAQWLRSLRSLTSTPVNHSDRRREDPKSLCSVTLASKRDGGERHHLGPKLQPRGARGRGKAKKHERRSAEVT